MRQQIKQDATCPGPAERLFAAGSQVAWVVRVGVGVVTALCLATIAPASFADDASSSDGQMQKQKQEQEQGIQVDNPIATQAYTQVVQRPDEVSELQIASRRFVSSDGKRPDIWLVGAVHIGDPAYYQKVQAHLDQMGLVLYEGVNRPEYWSIQMTDGQSQVQRAVVQLDELAEMIYQISLRAWRVSSEKGKDQANQASASDMSLGRLPISWDEVDARLNLLTQDNALSILRNQVFWAKQDPWGHLISIQAGEDPTQITLICLGQDGLPGGQGFNQDIRHHISVCEHTFKVNEDSDQSKPKASGNLDAVSDLQNRLSRAMGYVFQMDAMRYDREHFVPSDIGSQGLQQAFAKRGVDLGGGLDLNHDAVEIEYAAESSFGCEDLNPQNGGDSGQKLMRELGGPMAGVSVSVMKVMLRFVEINPGMQQIARLMMIEMLGRPDLMEVAVGGVGNPEVMAVILHDRNQVVLDDLTALLDEQHRDTWPDSIGVFYGAAHLSDMADDLNNHLGYKPTNDVKWFGAMRADLLANGMPIQQAQMMKKMMQQMIDRTIMQQKAMAKMRQKAQTQNQAGDE